MTQQLIFEIGCEEIPARFMAPALAQLERLFLAECQARRIQVQGVRTLGTPRRLTLLAQEVAPMQADLEEERTGPPAKAAFRDGQPTKAAEGFARGQGVATRDLYIIETPRGEYVAARVFEAGRPAAELMPEILQAALDQLTFPKSMRWAAWRRTFARPVRWLMAILGAEVVPVSLCGVHSGRTTFGHRFAAPEPIVLSEISQYETRLEAAFVEVDPARRRATIAALAHQQAQIAGGVLVEDDALVDELIYLVEYPQAVLVNFSKDYLELPDEVLTSSMRSHQRYFSVAHPETGRLINACVVITNTPVRDPAVVRAGNLRVLKARLDDARFFWNQDLKRPLESRVQDLESVIWLNQLGSLLDRSVRMSRVAAGIASRLDLGTAHIDAASRAAYLAKADLTTSLVFEFTDLQGVMGREYALRSEESEEVARAIYEQYLPRGADDALPQTHAGACVALAERIDALVGIFGLGLAPKGNADPYALRRAALGVLRILQERGYAIPLVELLEIAHEAYMSQGRHAAFTTPQDELIALVRDFILTRHKHLLASDFPSDVVEAVLGSTQDDLLSARARVAALATLRDEADFEPLAIGFKRVVNILRKQADAHYQIPATVDPARLTDPQEHELHLQTERARQAITAALATRDWDTACRQLITLKGPIDAYFDHVMVMTEDEALRQNRLATLDQLRKLFLGVADMSRIQTEHT